MTDKQNYFTYTDNTSDNNDKTMENLHKQIIIDGVDVHWCEHYTGNIGYLTDKNWTCRAKIQGTKCEDLSNCYFKRWKRKEQECEELKEKYLKLKEQNGSNIVQLNTVNEQLDQLKAENGVKNLG